MAILNGGFPGGGGAAEEVYSTEETRIGTWIDGKPLYRKVVRGTLPSAVANNFYTIVNGETVVSYCVVCYQSKSNTYMQFPFQGDFGWGGIFVIANGLSLRGTMQSMFGSPYTAILEYTKTTDPAPTSTLSAAPAATRIPANLPTTAVTAAESGI